ncbi:E3 ubiquitin-protein ligase RNF31-like [Asterias rubens]|uniref:E3 ubiquitin-protein ligase RNF31-like n=1 Tax=Asterias rubens TaxID=7604 RepID=UPI001455863C|nr:E3 ubiquitin-protein ligase RNF31-like [Asterias rubens]XP_033625879.1 E3 ubiquitin-protein ligase RNF31-like [Asterias rubens]
MDTPCTTAAALQRPSVLVPKQEEPIATAVDSKYANLDNKVLETVKELHVQLEILLKTIPLDESRIQTTLDTIVSQNCPLPAKFSRIDVSDLLKKNKNIRGEESLKILVSALGLLEKYGRNLLRPKRPTLWKCIFFANSVFRTRVDIIKGARHILQLMGYSEVVEDGLSFPTDSESADPDVVANITADLAIAKTEIDMYHLKQHPYPYRIKDCLDGTMTMIQIPGDSPSGTPKSFFVRRPEEGRATIYENVPNQSQPFPTRNPPNNIQLKQSQAPVIASKPQHYAFSENVFSNNDGIVSKIGNLASKGSQVPGNKGFGYFAQNPECVVTVKDSTQEINPQPAKQTSAVVHVRGQADQMKATDSEETECVMCGKKTANMQCPTCPGLRCESCDRQWHIHPSRRSHQRNQIEASPVPVSFPPIIFCNVCGTEPATVLCNNCSSSFCGQHDVLFHNHPQRGNHVRQLLSIEPQIPTAESPPPKNIVLSPVDTPLSQSTQDSSRTPESSSRSGSTKKRPVPAPRTSVKKSNKSDSSQPNLSPVEGSKFDDDVFNGQAKPAYADLKVQAREITRTQSDTMPIKTKTAPSSNPEPFYSLPANTNNVTALLENVVKRDIAVLQKIRGLRSAITTEGLAVEGSLKAEERHLLAEHTLLLKKQKELEESMKGLGLSSSTEEVEVVRKDPVASKESHVKPSPRSVAQDVIPTTPVKTVGAAVNLDEVSRQTVQKTQAVPTPTRRRSTSPPVPQKPNFASKSQHAEQRHSPADSTPLEAQSGSVSTPSADVYKPPQVSPRPQLSATGPGRVQQLATNIRLTTPAGNNNSVRLEAWFCPQCGDHNTSLQCLRCKTQMPLSSNTGPSVAALGQQLGSAIPVGVPQTLAKPSVKMQRDVQPPQGWVDSQIGDSQQSTAGATVGAAATAGDKPQPLHNFFLLQQLDEIAVEKQRAKEEDERNQAREKEEVIMTQTGLFITPRSRKLRTMVSPDPPAAGPTKKQPILNQVAAAGLAQVIRTEDRRRLDEQWAQSLAYIKLLQDAEDCGFLPEDVMVATESINRTGGQQGQELQWLQSNWEDYIYTVVAMSTNHLKNEVGQSVGVVTSQEAMMALRKHYGCVEKAVEECVGAVQRRVLSLVDLGFDYQRVYESLADVEGKTDDALIRLNKGLAKGFADRIWQEDNEDLDTQERVILNHGAEDRLVTVNRRLRLLLADYELPSWGRAETAARLIDTRKYATEDAIIAARECGDFQRATQYLEKTCSICYTEFPMNKLNTLINCQCTICLECLQNHFTVVVRDRNILNATCPACDMPDLREGEVDAMSDYFGFLDMLLKGFLDEATYGLFQNKLLMWNLMKQDDFRWCSHCGNGFINEAPGRRKMRCPECNKLTCFQCKKPWMDQHENITCDEFQAWKEANDPNAQLQGLAIHLKENGIDCPKCKMRYELAKGGCMHFKCGMCTHEFCSGCNAPFKKDCRKFSNCLGKGLHAHHPRDCLFYLRDLDINTLKKHLKKHNIDYKRNHPASQEAVCTVMEQKEGPGGLADALCGRDTVRSGLCEIHYKEYLVSKMNQNRIDPADGFNIEGLCIILFRNNLPSPARADNEPEATYRERMLQEVKRNLPLEEKNPRDRSQSVN